MIGFLLTLVLVVVCTLVALVRPRRESRLTYFLAVVVNEVPHLVALYLVLTTGLTLVEDDLSGVAGALVLAVVAATLVGLGELARRTFRARAAVGHGLAAAGIAPQRLPIGRRLGPLLLPLPIRPWRVRRIPGIRYGEHRRQRLDVYRLRRQQSPGPVFVYLHGGGYFSGNRHWEARALINHLTSRGWVCVSAGYRLRPGAGFPEHLADARAVVAWAHAHAKEYGGDPRTLVMSGSSAGAHLTSICALTQRDQPDPASSRVDAAVCLYGYFERYYGRGPDESPVSSPLYLDATSAPAFFLAHGDHDSYVPVAQARDLHRHLLAQSEREVVYAELPGAQHGFDVFNSWRLSAVIDGIDGFLAHTVDRPGREVTGPAVLRSPGGPSGSCTSG